MRLDKNRLSNCSVCGWHGTEYQLLVAPSPFRADDMLIACPVCRLTDGFAVEIVKKHVLKIKRS